MSLFDKITSGNEKIESVQKKTPSLFDKIISSSEIQPRKLNAFDKQEIKYKYDPVLYDYEKELAELKPLYERELSKYEKKISDISSSYKSPLYKELLTKPSYKEPVKQYKEESKDNDVIKKYEKLKKEYDTYNVSVTDDGKIDLPDRQIKELSSQLLAGEDTTDLTLDEVLSRNYTDATLKKIEQETDYYASSTSKSLISFTKSKDPRYWDDYDGVKWNIIKEEMDSAELSDYWRNKVMTDLIQFQQESKPVETNLALGYDATVGAGERALKNSKKAQKIVDLLVLGKVDEAIEYYKNNKFETSVYEDYAEAGINIKPSNLYTISSGVASLIGQQGAQLTNPLTAIATVGGGALGGIIGSVVPGAGTVAGAKVGAKIGGTAGSAANAASIEAGFAFAEMIDAGVDKDAAKSISFGVGITNGALEFVQFSKLLKFLDTAGTTKMTTKQLVKTYAGSVLENAIQETLQEGATIAGVNYGKYLSGLDTDSTETIVNRLIETAKSSLITFGIFNAPGLISGMNTSSKIPKNDQGQFIIEGKEKTKYLNEVKNLIDKAKNKKQFNATSRTIVASMKGYALNQQDVKTIDTLLNNKLKTLEEKAKLPVKEKVITPETKIEEVVQETEQTQEVEQKQKQQEFVNIELDEIDAKIKQVESEFSRIDVRMDEKTINANYEMLTALREQKKELLLKQTEENKLAEIAKIEQETKEIEAIPTEEQTTVVKDTVVANKELVGELVADIDKDKPIKTTYNRKYILDNKTQIFEKANEIVNSLNQERPSDKPIEIQLLSTYTPAQNMLADVGAIFKKQVIFLNNADFGGMVPLESDDIIFINDKVDNELILSNNETDKLTYAVGHELFHSLKKTTPDIFNEFTDFVKADISEEQLIKFMEKYDPTDKYGLLKSMQIEGKFNLEELKQNPSKYKKQTKALNYIVEEIVANEFGGMITDETYMTNLKNKNKGLFTKLVKALKELFSAIDTPIYDTPLTQMQITRIRNDFETVSKFLSEELETKAGVKPIESKVETNKQEVKKTEVKEEIVKKQPAKQEEPVVDLEKQPIPEVKEEKLPVKQQIEQKVEIKEEYQKNYWEDIGGKPANIRRFNTEHGRLTVMERQDNGTNSIFETYVDPEYRNQGLGTKLLQAALEKYPDLDGQFSSEASIKNAYKLGFRTLNNDSLENTLQIQKDMSSVYMIHKDTQSDKTSTTKETKLPVKKEVKKEELPKKETIKQEVKPVETKVEEKPKIKKEVKKPLPKKEKSLTLTKEEQARLTELASKPIIDTTAKVTKVDVESRLGYINKTLDRYNQETNATNKRELLNAATRAYDNYKKDGGKEVIEVLEKSKQTLVETKKEEFKAKLSAVNKMLPSKKQPTQYATAAPYYNTKITSDNFNVIKDKVHAEFNKKAHEFAGELGIEIANVSINKGGFTFQEGENAGKQVEELSYTYELKNATSQQADYFASLLGDLGYEGQEAVIAYNYVAPNDSSANIVEFGIKVNNTEGVGEILKNNGVFEYTIDTTEGIIKILDFDMTNQDATVDKINNIIRDLGGKYEKTTRQSANSRYLNSETRQKTYTEWLQTNRTNKQNRNLRAHFEQAQRKITGETKYLPTKEEYGVSKFATNTVQKSIAFSDVASEILNNPEMYQYSRKTHDEARAEGLNLMKTAPQETLDKIMRNDSVLNPGEKAFALLMKEYYKQKGDKDSGLALVKILKESDTRGGQSVEASKLYQYDPDFIVEDYKNMLDKMYEEFKTNEDPTITKWMKEHTDGIKLTEGEEKYLYDMADKLKGLDENSDEYKTRWALMNTYIANKMPKEFWTKVKNFRRMGFLFNPKTIIRNWFGNVSMVPVYKATDLVGSKLDKFVSEQLKTQRTTGTFIKEAYKEGQREGKRATKRDYQLGILTGLGNPHEVGEGQTFSDKNVIGKTLNEVERLTNYLMARGDRGYEQGHYLNTLTNLMRLNGVETATEEMIQIAKDNAAKRTWKNSGKMVEVASGIRKTFNVIGIKDGKLGVHNPGTKVSMGLGDVILPFIMTPANLLVATYDFSPAAALTAMKTWKDLKTAIKDGKNIQTAQKAFVDSTSRAMVGTLLYIVAGALAKMGAITGGEDEDKDKRELDKILGNQPFSIKIGDTSFSYDWLQPLSNIFATMGEVERQKTAEKTNFAKLVGEAFTVGGDRLLEQSFLQNVKTLLGGSYNDDKSLGDRVVDLTADIPSSMIPTLFKQLADYLDPNIKAAYDKNSPLQTMLSKTMARIPVVKSALPTKKDVLGNNLRYHNSYGTGIFTSFLSPMNIKSDVAGDLGDELVDVFNHTGDKTIIPQVAIKYIDYDSDGDGKTERFNFNPSQQSKLQEAMGKIVSDSFENIFANDVYMNATYNEKATALKSLMEYAKGKALEESGLVPNYLSGNPNAKQIKKYIDSGLDISDSIMYDSIIDNIEGDKDEFGETIEGTTQGKKAFAIVNMQISDNSKNVMLDLITTAKVPETIDNLSKLKTQQDFINYYSLSNRDNYNIATETFKIKGDTFIEATKGLSDIKSDKDSTGKTIEDSRKKKVIKYINSIQGLTSIQKTYLYGVAGYSIKAYKNDMYKYINSLPMTKAEKAELWKSLGL